MVWCTPLGFAGGGRSILLDRAEWERVIAINLTGTFLVAKAALARMIEQPRVDGERGSIVTLASIEGLEGTPRVAASTTPPRVVS